MLYTDHHFSDSFCADIRQDCLDALADRQSFNLVALPGVGVTFFVKDLDRRSPADFVYINPYEMHDLTASAVYAQLAQRLGVKTAAEEVDLREIGEAIKRRTERTDVPLVIVFNRFDRLNRVVDAQFYDTVRYLRDIDRSNVVIMFVTSAPLIEIAPNHSEEIVRLVTKTLYFPGHTDEDIQEIVAASGSRAATKAELQLAGGHHLLLQVLMGCQDIDNALSDPMVELLIKDIVAGLSPHRRKLVERAAAAYRLSEADVYLLGTRFVRQDTQKRATVFSPLLGEYLERVSTTRSLPVKEKRLFRLLEKHVDEVVSKQDIFEHVWAEEDGIASDWSLNALVYRLRRHPAFDARRYSIESHKKEGYRLVDHFRDS